MFHIYYDTTSVDLMSRGGMFHIYCWAERVPCPTNKGVSYTNLTVTLKIDYYYYYIINFANN
jgi:hypothetical protein